MKTLLRIATTVLLTYALLSLTYCESKQNNGSTAMNEEREELSRNLTELRDDIDARVEEIDKKMDNASDESKKRLVEANKELLHDRQKVEDALAKLDDATEETWSDVRKGARTTFQDVKTKFTKLGSRMADVFEPA